MSIYSKVPIRKPGRNAFNLSHTFRGSANIGELRVIARPLEAVPGDTFITGNISKVELSPIITNFFGELYWETFQFFVSNDMLYVPSDSGKFTDIIASLQNPESILSLPYYNSAFSNVSLDHWIRYLYGVGGNFNNLISKHILQYPGRAVIKIWNDWFRDENLQSEFGLTASDKLYVNYKKDRYTSAFLTTQKGYTLRLKTNVSLNLGNLFLPASVSPDYTINGLNIDPNGANGIATSIPTSELGNKIFQFNQYVNNNNSLVEVGFTINDLRLYNKLQKWQERNQLCGTRIKEYLLANYGVTPNDETLQRPVLIGHTKVPVVVDPIISNIQRDNLTPSQTPTLTEQMQNKQGSRGGVAGASSSFRYGKWFCKEFGWIITLGVLRPKASYAQGIHKSLRKTSVVDFFNPIFEHLGQQEIKKSELYFSNTSTDDEFFGFTDIYNEMRHIEDFTAPDLVNGYENKTMFRKFNSAPTLSSSFITVTPDEYDYLFALPHSTAPQAFFTSANVIKAVRPISKRSTPSL